MFEGTSNTNNQRTKCEFNGDILKTGVLKEMLRQSFNGSNKVINSSPKVLPENSLNINSMSINPSFCNYPRP